MPTPRYGTGAAHIPGVCDKVVGGCGIIRNLTQSVDKAEIFSTTSSSHGYATGAAHIPGIGGWTNTGDERTPINNAETFLTTSSPLGHAGS
ncbi:unnamed protein product [Rodentolepis nana]|uniref:Alkaline phosphatase n=1 Tax=Rodentolepis nana TaxID=102285 RepID=A0A0R3TA61_RODNA|nr:unnamed protein product [Rodentolepis nana]